MSAAALRPIRVQPCSIGKISISPSSLAAGEVAAGAGQHLLAPPPAIGGGRAAGSGEFGGRAPWSCIASKIESRRKEEPPQRGQSGSWSFSRRESWEPQSRQKNVPGPGIDPVSIASSAGALLTLVKMVTPFLRLVTILARVQCDRHSGFSAALAAAALAA